MIGGQDGVISGVGAKFFEVRPALFQCPNIGRVISNIDVAGFAQQLDIFPPLGSSRLTSASGRKVGRICPFQAEARIA